MNLLIIKFKVWLANKLQNYVYDNKKYRLGWDDENLEFSRDLLKLIKKYNLDEGNGIQEISIHCMAGYWSEINIKKHLIQY